MRFIKWLSLQKPIYALRKSFGGIDVKDEEKNHRDNTEDLMAAGLDLQHQALQKTLYLTALSILVAIFASGVALFAALHSKTIVQPIAPKVFVNIKQ